MSNPDGRLRNTVEKSGQPDHPPGCGVQIDIVVAWASRESRHRAHGTEQRVEESGAYAGTDVAYRHDEAAGRALQIRVVAQAQMRFRHANGQVVETLAGVQLDPFLGFR